MVHFLAEVIGCVGQASLGGNSRAPFARGKSTPARGATAAKAEARGLEQKARLEGLASRKCQGKAACRPARPYQLDAVQVRRHKDDFQIVIKSPNTRKSMAVSAQDMGRVLRDLETAIKVIRAWQ
jgi:hypothetical protein